MFIVPSLQQTAHHALHILLYTVGKISIEHTIAVVEILRSSTYMAAYCKPSKCWTYWTVAR